MATRAEALEELVNVLEQVLHLNIFGAPVPPELTARLNDLREQIKH